MNNETISNLSSQIISDTYITILQEYTSFAAFTSLIYASLLDLPDEVEYIWRRKFTLPTYLYLLSKYVVFFYFFLVIFGDFSPLSVCHDVTILLQVVEIIGFSGIQGLIVLRTYAVCQGRRPRLTMLALSIPFFIAFAAALYEFTLPSCVPPSGSSFFILDLIHNTAVIIMDVLAFVVVFYHVWGLWRLKRSLNLQSNIDIATSLLRQGVLRFFFALFISATGLLFALFSHFQAFTDVFSPVQNALSLILLCEFTLDLRRHNSNVSVPNQSAFNLPTLSFHENPVQSIRSVLGRLHESVISEMGDMAQIGYDNQSPEESAELRAGSLDPNSDPEEAENEA